VVFAQQLQRQIGRRRTVVELAQPMLPGRHA
jgi:hypothetical protein